MVCFFFRNELQLWQHHLYVIAASDTNTPVDFNEEADGLFGAGVWTAFALELYHWFRRAQEQDDVSYFSWHVMTSMVTSIDRLPDVPLSAACVDIRF